jgi:hypothetical protein
MTRLAIITPIEIPLAAQGNSFRRVERFCFGAGRAENFLSRISLTRSLKKLRWLH